MSILPSSTYCSIAQGHEYHGPYHDHEYGFPVESDDLLFERLMLEINQAGLSWLTILTKRVGLRSAYDGFAIERVAEYGDEDRTRLMRDPRIIRNHLKIEAAISNARTLLDIRVSHGSFMGWLDQHHRLDIADWTRLFKKTFRYTGGEITASFLMSTGYLPGAHHPTCPVHETIRTLHPKWMQ